LPEQAIKIGFAIVHVFSDELGRDQETPEPESQPLDIVAITRAHSGYQKTRRF